jgi:hypothetical protein
MSFEDRVFEIEGTILTYPTHFRDGRIFQGLLLVDRESPQT